MLAAEALFNELKVEQPNAFELARVASFAVRVDPPLLRRLRLRLHPGLDAGTEADLWFSDIVTTRGPEGFVIDPEVAELLRRHLALGPARYETAWQITSELHQGLSPALQLEEEVSYLLHTQQPGAEERIVELFRSAVAALHDQSRSSLAHWAARALPRFPEVVRRLDEARMLSAGAHLRLEANMSTSRPVPEDAFGHWMAWMSPNDLVRIPVGLRLFPEVLEIGDPHTMEDALVVRLPRTDPLLLDVAFDEPSPHDTGERPTSVADRGGIFISYRRTDTPRPSKLLADSLEQHFGADAVHFDTASIEPGLDFPQQIKAMVDSSAVVLVIIGPRWLYAKDADKRRWIDDPGNFVRMEIEQALNNGTPVIPVLVGGTDFPSITQLPASLQRFAEYQAVTISEERWQYDVESLVKAIERTVGATAAPEMERLSKAAPPGQAVESQAARTFMQLRFQPGETRRVSATSQRVRLRNVLGEESILQPSLDTPQFTEQLAEAISLQDQLKVEKLCRRFIAFVRYSPTPVPADASATILDQLRRGFFAPLMEEVANSLVESGQGSASIRLQWIESLIDQGKLEEASESVQALLDETMLVSQPKQRAAALELVGEIRKQMALSELATSPPESSDKLRYAIEAYLQAYEINPDAGIEAVALLIYAERNGVRIGEFPDPHGLAKEILRTADKEDWRPKPTVERLATLFQAELALGQEASALEHLSALRALPETDSFVLRTLRRQLTTVWQLGEESKFGHQALSMLDGQAANESETYDIRWLQGALNRLFGSSLSEDGRLGQQTRKLLEQFQKSMGLSADGIFGPATRQKLEEQLKNASDAKRPAGEKTVKRTAREAEKKKVPPMSDG